MINLLILGILSLNVDDPFVWKKTITTYVDSCRSVAKEDKAKASMKAAVMLSVELREGIPKEMLGMSIAAACRESGFDSQAKGDHKFSKSGKPKAIGVLQLWPWVEKYGVDRTSLVSSTSFWLNHIIRTRKKTLKFCRPRSNMLSWRQAWVAAVRAPKKSGRCREVSKHWKHFLRLRKLYKNNYERARLNLTT